MAVVAVDNRLTDLIDLDVQPERIATGYRFTEGPVWDYHDKSLIFVDIEFGNPEGGAMYRWTEGAGAQIFRSPSQNSNGNTYDRQGCLVTCVGGGRKVVRTNLDGNIETLASEYKGRPLNAPNDVICTPNGDLIFTDPALRGQTAQPQPRSAVYRISADDGSLMLLTEDLNVPNGLVMSTDGSRLYIDDTREANVRVFDVGADGRLSNDRIFCELKAEGLPQEVADFLYVQRNAWPETILPLTARAPDGMKMDSLGNLYVTPNRNEGVWVFDPEGVLLGFIGVSEEKSAFSEGCLGGPANLAWGNDDWQTLYITAVTSVYRVRLKVPGQPV